MTPYEGKEGYIFISYSHLDSKKVLPFIEELSKTMNVWYDNGIHPGSEWAATIAERLDRCSLFIFMISKNSLASENCKNEIAYVTDSKARKNFLNVFIEDVELSGALRLTLGRFQHFMAYKYDAEQAVKLLSKNCLDLLAPCKKKNKENGHASVNDIFVPQPLIKGKEIEQCQKAVNYAFAQNDIDAAIESVSILTNRVEVNILTNPVCDKKAFVKLAKDISDSLEGAEVTYFNDEIERKEGYRIMLPHHGAMVLEEEKDPERNKMRIPLGVRLNKTPVSADLTKMPHLLIAGSTGSGKSMLLHSIITSLIAKNTPDELKFVLIDPKYVEMTIYRNLPHLYCPIARQIDEFNARLAEVEKEMDRRYELFMNEGLTSINDYNLKYKESKDKKLPYIVVVIDELADVIGCNKEAASIIVRLTMKSRAAGIHIIAATQRTIKSIISPSFRANFSSTITLRMNSSADSKLFVGSKGAETLRGNGDMILICPEVGISPIRLQGYFISFPDIKLAVEEASK